LQNFQIIRITNYFPTDKSVDWPGVLRPPWTDAGVDRGHGGALTGAWPSAAPVRQSSPAVPYAEFSYNSSYQESFKMAPFEMLYGHRCRTPLFWNETEERKLFGPDILQEAEKQVCMVRENLRVVQ
jgi:hypothetical protein